MKDVKYIEYGDRPLQGHHTDIAVIDSSATPHQI